MVRGIILTSTSVAAHKILWGLAGELAYNYYLSANTFLSFNYLYSQSQTYTFSNTANTDLLNGKGIPGPTTLDLNRRIKITAQGITVSVNRVFW